MADWVWRVGCTEYLNAQIHERRCLTGFSTFEYERFQTFIGKENREMFFFLILAMLRDRFSPLRNNVEGVLELIEARCKNLAADPVYRPSRFSEKELAVLRRVRRARPRRYVEIQVAYEVLSDEKPR
jgi:hypothetical protein